MSIPAEVLSVSREFATFHFDRTGSILTLEKVEDDAGGWTETDTLGATFNFGILPGMGGQQSLQQQLLERIGNREYFILRTAVDVVITEDDVIKQLTPSVIYWRVLGIPNKDITYQITQKVVVIRDGQWEGDN